MPSNTTQLTHYVLNHKFFNKLSIKSITLLGFVVVAFPLTLALIYSAIKVNQLSQHGVEAVYSVAAMAKANQELSKHQENAERFASQYIVLDEISLKQSYFEEKAKLTELISQYLTQPYETDLLNVTESYLDKLTLIDHLLENRDMPNSNLAQVQQHFIELAKFNQEIKQITNKLITLQAESIKKSATQVERLMLNSLLMIPLTLIFAAIFTLLLTQPLKILIKKIKQLELGNFKHPIEISSNPEIEEIAQALEYMRQRLHALELQKTSFIRHISHELKTPLAAIREGNALLHDHSVGPLSVEQNEVCSIIKTNVIRLQSLIEDLLDFNIVLDASSLEDNEQIELSEVINQVIETHSLELKRKQIKVDYQARDINFKSNLKQLNVIFENLISNAIKYSPQAGVIKIDTLIAKDNLAIKISDQGPGIDEKIAEQVFDAFFQGPKPENHEDKGSGLGLTIVKELVMRLNGNIQVGKASSLKSGTTFNINLPFNQLKE